MPAWMPMPAKANTPVSGIEPPITMSSAALACGMACGSAKAVPSAKASPSRVRRIGLIGFLSVLVVGCPVASRPSLLKRPEMEEAADAPPDLGKPLRLEQQEADDEQ